MTFLQLEALSIPSVWIAALGGFLIAPFMNRLLTRQRIGDWYWNSMILYVLAWKLSYLFFYFHLVIQMPLSILYFDGGAKGNLIGLAVLGLYLLRVASKTSFTFVAQAYTRLFLLFFFSYQVVMGGLNDQHVIAINHLILLGFLVILFRSNQARSIPISNHWILLFLLMELLILSLFDTILSSESVTMLGLSLIAFILNVRASKEEKDVE